jgi:hypothetical protein
MLNKIWPILEPTLPKSSPFIVAWDILIKEKKTFIIKMELY